jgi:hypothetical protein
MTTKTSVWQIINYCMAVSVIVFNIVYLLPETVSCLEPASGIKQSLQGFALEINYILHVFLVYSCISLVKALDVEYKHYVLKGIMVIFFISFCFAVGILGFGVLIPAFIYLNIYLTRSYQIKTASSSKHLRFIYVNLSGCLLYFAFYVLTRK